VTGYDPTVSQPPPDPPVTDSRRIVAAVIASDLGAVAIAIGGILALSAGLVVIAAVTGVAVGWFARGVGRTPTTGVAIAIAVALGGIAIGQFLLWFVAGLEGGVLGPIDYLAQAFGVLVPAQFVAAGAGAWLAAR